MFFGVEGRLPFLDYRLVEYAGKLNPEVKMCNSETKHVIRASLRGITPNAILDRHKKQPWPAPIERWLREPGGVLDEVAEKSPTAFFARPSNVRDMIQEYRNGHDGVHMTDVWRMACTILWYCRFFGPEG